MNFIIDKLLNIQNKLSNKDFLIKALLYCKNCNTNFEYVVNLNNGKTKMISYSIKHPKNKNNKETVLKYLYLEHSLSFIFQKMKEEYIIEKIKKENKDYDIMEDEIFFEVLNKELKKLEKQYTKKELIEMILIPAIEKQIISVAPFEFKY